MKKTLLFSMFSCFVGASFAQVTTYTTAGNYTFTVPPGITSVTAEVVGAGGTGGGNGGGGGGGGGYAKGVYNVTPGATVAVKVGTGGGGPAAGTSSVAGMLSATGGDNGTWVNNPQLGGGGVGGVGSGGTIANYTGGTGGGGYWTYFGGGGAGAAGAVSNGSNGGNTIVWSGVCQTPGGTGGNSGGAPGGNGGKGAGFTDGGCNVTDPAGNGNNYGAGGGGGNGNGGGPGTGAVGYVQISWQACTPPAAPTNTTPPANLLVCGSGTTMLSATGNGTITWYASPTSTSALGTGTNYTTPVITNSVTYYAETTNTCAPSATRTAITITVNPVPAVSAITSTATICSGESATLTASNAASYTWNPGGQTGSVVVVSPTITTTYTVTGMQDGCTGTNTVTQNVTICTGISQWALQNLSAEVFPNPFTDKLTLTSAAEIRSVKIYSATGQIIYTNENPTGNIEIDMTGQQSGIYFIRLESLNGTTVKKIVKE